MERDYVTLPSNLAARRRPLVLHPVHIRIESFKEHYVSNPHFHDFPQIWYCVNGNYTHKTLSGNHSCGRGSLIVIPPGRPDGFIVPAVETIQLICLEISPLFFSDCNYDEMPRTLEKLFAPMFTEKDDCFKLSKQSSQFVENLIYKLQSCPGAFDSNSLSNICSVLEEIFSLPEFDVPTKFEHSLLATRVIPMLQALAFINAHYDRKIHMDELTQITAMCQTNFMTHFKHFTNINFSIYTQLLRYSHARRLIGSTDYPLSHIADICGYTDAAYLIHSFKKFNGKTPRSRED